MRRTAAPERICSKGASAASHAAILLWVVLFSLLPARNALCEPTVRVLLVDNKVFKIPEKNDTLKKLGTTKGDVLISGLKYSGHLEVWKGDSGLFVINEVPLEEYVKGVVAGEVGSTWPSELLKAQAVVARTYALHQMQNGSSQFRYHLTSSVLHQMYKGGAVPDAVVQAVEDTRMEVLTYEGKPIAAYYHSTSDGMTEDSFEVFGKSYPYLRPVQTRCELSPYCVWERRVPYAEVEKSLGLAGIEDIRITSRTVSQRAKQLSVLTKNGGREILAKDFRKQLGWERIPSTMITTITREGNYFVFEGKGYGHGVGMCQWSALQMAKAGLTYREILSTFYPGASLELYEDRGF